MIAENLETLYSQVILLLILQLAYFYFFCGRTLIVSSTWYLSAHSLLFENILYTHATYVIVFLYTCASYTTDREG